MKRSAPPSLRACARASERRSLHRASLVALPSGKLLHHDPVALDFVQIKLDRCRSFRRFRIRRLDLAQDFTLAAKLDDAPVALHPARELLGAVFLAGAAGRHQVRVISFASNPVLDLGSAPQAARRTMVRFCAHE